MSEIPMHPDACEHGDIALMDEAERLARLHSEAEAQIECRNWMHARIAELEKELAWLRGEVEAYGDPWTLKQRIAELEAENARLRAGGVQVGPPLEFRGHFDLDEEEDAGVCHFCKAPFEVVRPGKYQPTCGCGGPDEDMSKDRKP